MNEKEIIKMIESISSQHNIQEIELDWKEYVSSGIVTTSFSSSELKPVLKIVFK